MIWRMKFSKQAYFNRLLDADKVTIRFDQNALGALDRIRVAD